MMEELSLYVPGIMGLMAALVAYLSVRHIARPTNPDSKESQHPFEFAPPKGAAEAPSLRFLGLAFMRRSVTGEIKPSVPNASSAYDARRKRGAPSNN